MPHSGAKALGVEIPAKQDHSGVKLRIGPMLGCGAGLR
jgi:hypothetical protein